MRDETARSLEFQARKKVVLPQKGNKERKEDALIKGFSICNDGERPSQGAFVRFNYSSAFSRNTRILNLTGGGATLTFSSDSPV